MFRHFLARGGAAAVVASLAITPAARAAPLPPDDPARHEERFHCPPPPPDTPDFREAIAWLAYPRFDLVVPVFEGDSEAEFRRGAGHVPGTALPLAADRRGNTVLAAHRTTYFSPLESAAPGDRITLIGGAGAEAFIVEEILTVGPDRVDLEAPTAGRRLTLVTCTPFNYLGDAPLRRVVIARPEDEPAGPPGRTAAVPRQ